MPTREACGRSASRRPDGWGRALSCRPSSRISWSATLKSPPRSRRPLSSTRFPGPSRSASQAWLNQTAFAWPLASATAASTIRRLRRRVGRTRTLLTSASTVASSPILSSPSSPTFVRSRCARGTWSRRSPTVSIPRSAAAAASFGPAPRRLEMGASSLLGRGMERRRTSRSVASSRGSPVPMALNADNDLRRLRRLTCLFRC